MNKSILLILKEFLVTQLNHFNFFIFALTIVIFADSTAQCGELNPWLWFVIGLVPLYLYFIRKYVKNIFGFVIGHILAVIFVLLFPAEHTLFGIIYFVCGLCYCIHSIVLNYRKETIHSGIIVPAVTIGSCFICLVLLNNKGYTQWTQYYLTLTISIVCAYFIVYYMDNYLTFLHINKKNAGNIPKKKILFSGLKYLFGYVFIGLMVILATVNSTWLDYIIKPFKEIFSSVLGFIFSLFKNKEETKLSQETDVPEDFGDFMDISDGMDTGVWQVLQKIVFVIVICFLGYLLLKVIFKVISLVKNIVIPSSSTDKGVLEEVDDIREKCDIVNKDKKRSRTLFAALSYEERIRKTFKKKVKAAKYLICNENDDSRLALYTAKECAHKLDNPHLAEIYEKARYSDIPCSKEDVSGMKEACR